MEMLPEHRGPRTAGRLDLLTEDTVWTTGMRSVGELRGRMLRIHPVKGWPVPSTHT